MEIILEFYNVFNQQSLILNSKTLLAIIVLDKNDWKKCIIIKKHNFVSKMHYNLKHLGKFKR